MYVTNIEICVFYKFGATGAVPAGAFFPSKIHLYFLKHRILSLCLSDIKYILFMSSRYKNMLGAPPSMPAGAFFLPKIDPIFFEHAI